MRILGVDPGAYGALALIDSSGRILELSDMPILKVRRGKTDKAEVDGYALGDMLRSWGIDLAFIEQVGGMTGQSPSASFNFGRSEGIVEGAIKFLRVRVESVPPATWKRFMRLRGGKDDSRAMAIRMWPKWSQKFARKKDDGRAEACLIAEYGRRQIEITGGNDVFD